MGKANTPWFKHDYNARTDPKLIRLRRIKKMSGVGVYWHLIEILHEQNNKINVSEIEDIAFEMGEPYANVLDIINEFDLFKTDNNIVSNIRVAESLDNKNKKSAKARESIDRRWGNKVPVGKVEEKKSLPPPPAGVQNWFYIGIQRYDLPVSKFMREEFQRFLDEWPMKNKEIKIQEVFNEMDKDLGKEFSGLTHIRNTFTKTAKDLLRAKDPFNKNQTTKVVASGNYGRSKNI